MEAGHYGNDISQPRWMASSPDRAYDEDARDVYANESTSRLGSEEY